MALDLLSLSNRVYRRLLLAYPPTFRQQYGVEMAQVFRTHCRIAFQMAGVGGVLRLWLPTLLDWVWTAARERLASLFSGRYDMNDTTLLDRQLSDAVWLLVGGLRSGYSLPQCLEALAVETPAPASQVFGCIVDALRSDQPIEKALDAAHRAWPSAHLKRIVDAILAHRRTGSNLAVQIEPLYEEIRAQAGSDEALYPAMRRQAYQLGRPLPDYARPRMTWDTPTPLPDVENTTVYDADGTPVASADYLYPQARIFVLVSGQPKWQAWIKGWEGRSQAEQPGQRIAALGYRTLVVPQQVADAGIQEVAAYAREVFPELLG